MNKIAIYGAGGLGRVVACLLNKINEVEPVWELIGFFDDGIAIGTRISHFGKVLGGLNELNAYPEELSVAISIADSKKVASIVSRVANDKVEFPNIIAPAVYFSDPETFKIGKGNIIHRNCSFSCDVTVGDFNVMVGEDMFGHDTEVGSFNTFMPAINIAGKVTIGDGNFFGIGSIILQKIKVGNNIRLGAGSVLMHNPKDGSLLCGNPAKKLEL